MINYGKTHPDAARAYGIPTTTREILAYEWKNLRKHQYVELSTRSYRSSGSGGRMSLAAKVLALSIVLLLILGVT